MATKLVECEHCGGKKNCTSSGGKSCRVCLDAAGIGRRRWATVRCSYCGGRGKVWVEEEEESAEIEEEGAETEEKGDEPAEETEAEHEDAE